MAIDGHIRVLPVLVANKIAAGEVVERPASVLKELIENALDAGARRIDVEATQGGRKLVSVRDDGCGMTREDAVLALERQATSKIRDVDDIEHIATLGFRGEAVPSIASVSRFTIVTRRRESEAGTRITVNAGTVAEVGVCGAPPGTCMEVRDLFCNVPARRKFLRSYATEEGHLKDTFTVHALAHPDVGFSLTLDGREVYRLAPGATLAERIAALFGTEFAESLLLLPERSAATPARVAVHGYIARPARIAVRTSQYIFVNGRPATAPTIAYALKEAYPRSRDDARPALFLFIDTPPEDVDVNVHPAKREVRFRKPAEIKQAVVDAIAGALANRAAPVPNRLGPTTLATSAPPVAAPMQFSLPVQHRVSAPPAAAPVPASTASPSAPVVAPTASPVAAPSTVAPAASPVVTPPASPVVTSPASPVTSRVSVVDVTTPKGMSDDARATPTAPDASAAPARVAPTEGPYAASGTTAASPLVNASGPWQSFKYLTQTDSGYILIETDSGIVTLNPQAAQERVAYERMLDVATHPGSDTAFSQPLLIPETVHLSPLESARLASFRDILESVGFALDPFGADMWKIDAVPALAADSDPVDTLRSIAFDIAEQGAKKGGARWREERVAKAVAKTCARASKRLTPEDAVRLVERLAACRMPYVCPRGKPVMIYTSNRELARRFAR